MTIVTTTDRASVPTLDETELIKLDESALKKIGARVSSVISGIAATALTIVGLSQDDIKGVPTGLVLLAAGIITAAGLFAWAIVGAADLRARGEVTAANLALRHLPVLTSVSAPAGAAGTTSGLWVHITGRESSDKHLVIAARSAQGATELLLARNDETPSWHPIGDVDHWEVKAAG
jgi:hypothetical protein